MMVRAFVVIAMISAAPINSRVEFDRRGRRKSGDVNQSCEQWLCSPHVRAEKVLSLCSVGANAREELQRKTKECSGADPNDLGVSIPFRRGGDTIQTAVDTSKPMSWRYVCTNVTTRPALLIGNSWSFVLFFLCHRHPPQPPNPDLHTNSKHKNQSDCDVCFFPCHHPHHCNSLLLFYHHCTNQVSMCTSFLLFTCTNK